MKREALTYAAFGGWGPSDETRALLVDKSRKISPTRRPQAFFALSLLQGFAGGSRTRRNGTEGALEATGFAKNAHRVQARQAGPVETVAGSACLIELSQHPQHPVRWWSKRLPSLAHSLVFPFPFQHTHSLSTSNSFFLFPLPLFSPHVAFFLALRLFFEDFPSFTA